MEQKEMKKSTPRKAACMLDAGGHCITCSDEVLLVKVLRVDELAGLALVAIQGREEEVDVTLVEGTRPGDWLMTHGGVAIERLQGPVSEEKNYA